jgi:hypothetical protein
MLSDRAFFGASLGLAGLIVALSLVFPQGEGGRSPWPFGHAPVVPSAVEAAHRRDAIHAREKSPLRPAPDPLHRLLKTSKP